MTKRFTDLERFLPPAPAEAPSPDERSKSVDPVRVRPYRSFRRWRRSASALFAAVFASALLVLGGLALGFAPQRSSPARDLGAAGDGVLEGGTNPMVDLERAESPKKAGRRVLKIKRARRVSGHQRSGGQLRQSAPAIDPSVSSDPGTQVKAKRVTRRDTGAGHKADKPQLPAPPESSLFRCESTKRSEWFMTIDVARVGQMEEPGAGWNCEPIGLVYDYEAPNTVAIELDDGTAYVFKERSAETEPDCEKVALYQHWAGYDYWYATNQVDGGPVGYVRV